MACNFSIPNQRNNSNVKQFHIKFMLLQVSLSFVWNWRSFYGRKSSLTKCMVIRKRNIDFLRKRRFMLALFNEFGKLIKSLDKNHWTNNISLVHLEPYHRSRAYWILILNIEYYSWEMANISKCHIQACWGARLNVIHGLRRHWFLNKQQLMTTRVKQSLI